MLGANVLFNYCNLAFSPQNLPFVDTKAILTALCKKTIDLVSNRGNFLAIFIVKMPGFLF
jgi:hypothetical protein